MEHLNQQRSPHHEPPSHHRQIHRRRLGADKAVHHLGNRAYTMRTAIAITAWALAITALTWTTYQISLKLAIFVGTIAIPIALIEIALSRIEQTNRGR